jgi:PAP2 superfamily
MTRHYFAMLRRIVSYSAFVFLLLLTACNKLENPHIVAEESDLLSTPDTEVTERGDKSDRGYKERGFPVSQYRGEIVMKWHEIFAELDRYGAGYRPTPVPRALGYINLAAYESVLLGMPRYQSLARTLYNVTLPSPAPHTTYYWSSVVNGVYYTSYKLFFPNAKPDLQAKIEALYVWHNNMAKNTMSPAIIEQSLQLGAAVAKAMYAWSSTDESGHNAYLNAQPTAYQPPVGDFLWKPAPPNNAAAMFPYWGKVRTFAITAQEKLALPPSHYIGAFSNAVGSPYYNELKEVYERTNNAKNGTSQGIFKDDKWIGEFWSDDILDQTFSPPCRLVVIAGQVARENALRLDRTLELYAKMGLTLSDAGVAIWNSKYTYNTERPVTGIRRLFDEKWLSGLDNTVTGERGVTPAFPGYPSGHSGFGAAGAAVLDNIFGQHYRFTDYAHEGRTEFLGMPRTFASFKDMAHEDAMSRIPLGVHVRMDCVEGLRVGEVVANKVLALPWRK